MEMDKGFCKINVQRYDTLRNNKLLSVLEATDYRFH